MHVVITGAAAGIGKALAEVFAVPENALSLIDRDSVDAVIATSSPNCAAIRGWAVDLNHLESCCDFLDEAEAAHGPVDILISNAAIGYIESAKDVSPERAEALFRINTLAPLRLIHRLLPGMLDRGTGTIAAVTSLTAIAPPPHQAHYSASKAALASFCEALRGEVKDTGVNILTVYPGPIATDMDRRVKANLAASPRLDSMTVGEPQELARRIQQSIQKRKARLVYPPSYAIVRWLYVLAYWMTVCYPIPLREQR